jgi:excinuclease ABC subunit C
MDSQYLKKKKLPDAPGVYFFKLGREILYIGKATSLRDRVRSYFAPDLIATRGPLIVDLIFKADKIDFIKTASVLEALILESNLIKKHQPIYNTKEKDDKSYNYVVLTDEDFPRVFVVRGKEIKLGLPYPVRSQFGPYPNGTQLREALGLIRKIFPFRDKCEIGQSKPCFNHQIGLCPGVCVGSMSRADYQKIIKNIELFLGAKTASLIKKLEREMKALARAQKFEEATKVRNTLFALNHIRDVSLIRDDEIRDTNSYRIEAYDAAHISGTNNVGVMVVSENGELKKADYRKFKIRETKGDDLGALREMLSRRLGHLDWGRPSLIVLDGGELQMKTARAVLSKSIFKDIPLVSVVKDNHHKAKALLGPAELVQKYKKQILLINNEAHRFAIAFHRQKRSVIL